MSSESISLYGQENNHCEKKEVKIGPNFEEICICGRIKDPANDVEIEKFLFDQYKLRRMKRCPNKEFLKFHFKQTPNFGITGCSPPLPKEVSELGSCVGTLFSTFSINRCVRNDHLKSLLSYCCCLYAFGECFLTPETEWNSILMNRILVESSNHLRETCIHEGLEKTDFNLFKNTLKKEICPEKPPVIKIERESKLPAGEKIESSESNEFLKIQEVTIPTVVKKMNSNIYVKITEPVITAPMESSDETLSTLKESLENLFQASEFCLVKILSRNHYYLVWKRYDVYFIFDPNGRKEIKKPEKTTTNEKNEKNGADEGYLLTLCVRETQHIVNFFMKLSPYDKSDIFALRKIVMSFIAPGTAPLKDIYRRKRNIINEYEVTDDNYARMRGSLDLSMSCFKVFQNDAYLAFALIAIAFTKIDKPSTWDHYVLDEITCLAARQYHDWSKYKNEKCCSLLTIYNIPNPSLLLIGHYYIKMSFHLNQFSGCLIRETINYRKHDLTQILKKAFKLNKKINFILELANNKIYPIIKRDNFYYTFDPYYHMQNGSTSIHMFNKVNLLCKYLINDIITSFSSQKFNLHAVIIQDIIDGSDHVSNYEPSCLEFHINYNPELSISDEDKKENQQSANGTELKLLNLPNDVESLNKSIEDYNWYTDCLGTIQQESNCEDLNSPTLSKLQITQEYSDLLRELKARELEICPEARISESETDSLGPCRIKREIHKLKPTEEIVLARPSEELERPYDDGCLPNSYPGYCCRPFNIAVLGSQKGEYQSIFTLILTGFKCVDRALLMTPWGNYIMFKSKDTWLLYNGCTCDVERFRHFDLTKGTAGLLCFNRLELLIEYVLNDKSEQQQKGAGAHECDDIDTIISCYCKRLPKYNLGNN